MAAGSGDGCARGAHPKHRKKRFSAERELERLRRKNERLEDQLAKHRIVLEAQAKASELLAHLLAQSTPETTQQPAEDQTR